MREKTRIEELEEEVRQLRKILMPGFIAPAEWKLTAQELGVVRLLVTRPYVTSEMVAIVLEIDKRVLMTVLSHIRKKVPKEIKIKNDRDRGWYMETWDKEAVLKYSAEWMSSHTIENIYDHLNVLRVFEMVASVDVRKLVRLLGLVKYVQKTMR